MSRVDELLASSEAPHDYNLGLQPGDVLHAEAPWPEVEIEKVEILTPKRLVWQQLTVNARRPLQGDSARFIVGRIVAVFDMDGEEREVEVADRVVVPAAAVEHEIDMSTCAACGAPLYENAVVLDDKPYCPGCVVEDPEPEPEEEEKP